MLLRAIAFTYYRYTVPVAVLSRKKENAPNASFLELRPAPDAVTTTTLFDYVAIQFSREYFNIHSASPFHRDPLIYLADKRFSKDEFSCLIIVPRLIFAITKLVDHLCHRAR